MATRIQLRKGTSTEWSLANPILAAGEIGVDLTNNELRVGDGTTAWESLAPIGASIGGSSIAADILVEDILNFYQFDNVEDILQEIGEQLDILNGPSIKNIEPESDAIFDLGSPENRWNSIYASDSLLVGDVLLSENVIKSIGQLDGYIDKSKLILDNNVTIIGSLETIDKAPIEYSPSFDYIYPDSYYGEIIYYNELITVGPSGDYTNLNDALIYCSKKYKTNLDFMPIQKQGVLNSNTNNPKSPKILIKLKLDYVLKEALFFENIDLSHVHITCEQTPGDTGTGSRHFNINLDNYYTSPYYSAGDGSSVSTIFYFKNSKTPVMHDMLYIVDSSNSQFPVALFVLDNSSFTTANGRPEIMMMSPGTTPDIILQNGSTMNMNTSYGGHNLIVRTNSSYSGSFHGNFIYAMENSQIFLGRVECIKMLASSNSRITTGYNQNYLIGASNESDVITASYGSFININYSQISAVTTAVQVNMGSTVVLSNCSGTLTANVTANTISPNGMFIK